MGVSPAKYLGCKYKGGRGLACWNFFIEFFCENFEIRMPALLPKHRVDVAEYLRLADTWILVPSPQKYDAVLMLIEKGRLHIGIMLNTIDYIHHTTAGVAITKLDSPTMRTVVGFYRNKEIENEHKSSSAVG